MPKFRLTVVFACLTLVVYANCAAINSITKNVLAKGISETKVDTQNNPPRPSIDQYKKDRNQFMKEESSRAMGSRITLNDRELLANEVIRAVKKRDMDIGFADPGKFPAAQHIFRVFKEISESDMFKLLQPMPKGGVLHTHDLAMASADFVMTLTYWADLWQWSKNDDGEDTEFIFSREQPEEKDGVQWERVSEVREREGAGKYDGRVRQFFTLYTSDPETKYPDINAVWVYFSQMFKRIGPLLKYVPVWKAYYKQTLKEFYEDGVQYLEVRGDLPDLYDLDGNVYKKNEVVQIYVDVLEEFKAENPEFIGAKHIYTPVRRVDDATFAEYMKTVIEVTSKFPNFVVGFDIDAQEDRGRPLIDFAEPLLNLPKDIRFFFHAAETKWNGMSTDENLIDAVLLGTKRIGHAFAILKHPKVLEEVRRRGIALELNPISNQVLTLSADIRNHPGTHLFAEDYPIVVSSDDHSFWEISPQTHDFYIAFMGVASAHSDLRMLKQLALNSLNYSAMNPAELKEALKKWETKWNRYIEWVISQRGKYNL